jgi:peptidoglycan/LPS O-acetylase OafA/YrhL
LFHLLFINIFFKYLNFPINNLLKLLLFFLTTLIFSHIVYNFFERPLIKIGKKLSTTYNAL